MNDATPPAVDPPGVVVGPDGIARCPWAAGPELMTDYHDLEWGQPVHGEQALFERISLEGFQAGLSWRTVLVKRPAFRTAFADFDPEVVAGLSDHRLDELMNDPGIIRNRAKIVATRSNARAVLALRAHGGLDEFVWSRRPPQVPAPKSQAEVATRSDASAAFARDLRRVGIKFIGPTSAYALMEAVGMIDTHLVGCHRRGMTAD